MSSLCPTIVIPPSPQPHRHQPCGLMGIGDMQPFWVDPGNISDQLGSFSGEIWESPSTPMLGWRPGAEGQVWGCSRVVDGTCPCSRATPGIPGADQDGAGKARAQPVAGDAKSSTGDTRTTWKRSLVGRSREGAKGTRVRPRREEGWPRGRTAAGRVPRTVPRAKPGSSSAGGGGGLC